MELCKQRIDEYYDSHGQLPDSLEDTSVIKRPSYEASTLRDGWGRKIQYQKKGDQKYSLTSLGQDNAVGGHGLAADITISYLRTGTEELNDPEDLNGQPVR